MPTTMRPARSVIELARGGLSLTAGLARPTGTAASGGRDAGQRGRRTRSQATRPSRCPRQPSAASLSDSHQGLWVPGVTRAGW
jgi:hypothetical protein